MESEENDNISIEGIAFDDDTTTIFFCFGDLIMKIIGVNQAELVIDLA